MLNYLQLPLLTRPVHAAARTTTRITKFSHDGEYISLCVHARSHTQPKYLFVYVRPRFCVGVRTEQREPGIEIIKVLGSFFIMISDHT
jgi:hypothetical protein